MNKIKSKLNSYILKLSKRKHQCKITKILKEGIFQVLNSKEDTQKSFLMISGIWDENINTAKLNLIYNLIARTITENNLDDILYVTSTLGKKYFKKGDIINNSKYGKLFGKLKIINSSNYYYRNFIYLNLIF